VIRRGLDWSFGRVDEEVFEYKSQEKEDGHLSQDQALSERWLESEDIVGAHCDWTDSLRGIQILQL